MEDEFDSEYSKVPLRESKGNNDAPYDESWEDDYALAYNYTPDPNDIDLSTLPDGVVP